MSGSSPSQTNTTADLAAYRRRWAYALVRKAKVPPPTYGSPEWHDLPEGSPEKIAAVVVAAECWALDGDDLPARLAVEIEADRLAEEHRLDELHAENVDMVHRLASRPGIGMSYAERRARELADAGLARPGDFRGARHLRAVGGAS